jgi:hypothetical protein
LVHIVKAGYQRCSSDNTAENLGVVPAGDGFSMRAEDAVLHGCIPVLIMDNILPILDPHLTWADFSIRIAEKDIPQLPQILLELGASGRTLVRPKPPNSRLVVVVCHGLI